MFNHCFSSNYTKIRTIEVRIRESQLHTLYIQFFDFQVNCSSRLYEIEIETTSQSYTPVGFFEIDTYRACDGAEKELGMDEH